MKAKRVYLLPDRIVYNGARDLMDSQNGREISGDDAEKKLCFRVMMFDSPWTLRFSAAAIDHSRCEAAIEVSPGDGDGEGDADAGLRDAGLREETRSLAGYVLRREYAMLDAILLIGTPVEARFAEGSDSE